MSLLPVVTPRSSDALQQRRLVYQVNADQVDLQGLYDQLSTGRRVLSGSDDPAAAARGLNLSAGIAHSEQLSRNAQATAGYLQTADSALSNVDAALIEARGVAVSAAQNILSDGERQALAQNVDELINRVLMVGNDAFQKTAVFGGVLTTEPPLSRELDGVLFAGNNAVAKPKLARNTYIDTLPTGEAALGLAKPAVKGVPLVSTLNEDTRLVDMRNGLGIKPGIVRITDGSGWQELDLRGSVTLGDLKERFESLDLGGRSLQLDIDADSITLGYADGRNGTLGIDDVPGSNTSVQLNINNPSAIIAPPLEGGALGPRTTPLTRLSDLNAGAGIDVSGGLRIQAGSQVTDIDLSTAEVVDDVLTAINRSGAPIRAELDATTGTINLHMLKSGVNYSIGELGGTAATDLGIRSSGLDTSLDDLLGGRGVRLNPPGEDDLWLERPDGTQFSIDVTGMSTIGDVIDAINSHPANQDVRRITAELKSSGNGIRLWGPVDTNSLTVRNLGTSDIGTALGLIPAGDTEAAGGVSAGVTQLVGSDPAEVEPGGTFDTLLRLREAVASGDEFDLARLTEQLNSDMQQTLHTRGEIGYRAQAVDALRIEAEDQTVAMKSRLSEEVDADLTQVISEISSKQAALEASLQMVGRTAALTVLNFL